MKPQQPRRLEISKEDLAKVKASREKREGYAGKVDEEWYFIAAFGKHFGWAGIEWIMSEESDIETANMLMAAANKVDYSYMLSNAQTSFIAAGAANSKKPAQAFKKMTKDIQKAAKI